MTRQPMRQSRQNIGSGSPPKACDREMRQSRRNVGCRSPLARATAWKTALLIGLVMSLLVGCRLPVLPTPLVKAPKLPINQAELQQVIQPFLPEGAKLTIPIRPQSNSAIWPVDLDGNGTANGALAFYKKPDTNMELGVIILEKLGDQWRLRDHIKEMGRDFDYVLFADLNGDRAPELLLGCSGGAKGTTAGMNNDLTIYTNQSGKLVGGQRIPYIDMATGDLDGDQRLEVAIMGRSERQSYITLVTVYHYLDSLKEAAQFELDGYPASLSIGGATRDKQGLFVELGMGAHSAKTVLVMPENGLWQRLFEGLSAPTFKAYPLGSCDLNGDGVVEIGKQVAPPGTERLAMVQIPWYEEWLQWDGQDGLRSVMFSYSDYLDRYRLVIPAVWQQSVTAERKESDGVRLIDFFQIGSTKERLAPLLTLIAIPKSSWPAAEQDYKTSSQRYLRLGENGDKVIVALIPAEPTDLTSAQLDEYRRLALGEEQLRAGFSILPR